MKPIMNTYVIVIIVLFHLINYSSISYAQQHSIGLTGGYNAGTFFNFSKKPGYDANYQLKSGFSVASFYETKMDSISYLRVELQYRFQNAGMEIYRNAGHASFYKNLDYSLHLLNLNLLYLFRIVDRKPFKANILFGPTFSYMINTFARGNGWDYRLVTQIDTSGNPVSFITTQNWEKDERNSKDLSRFTVGVDLGLEFIIPVRNQLDFLIQNRYTILITGVSKMKGTRPTSLFTGNLQVGLRYNLKK
jgi:hypothetical protein